MTDVMLRKDQFTLMRLLLGLRLLILALLLAGTAPLGHLTVPAISADEGKDESGKDGDDGDKEEKEEDKKDEDKDKDEGENKNEGRESEGQVERAAAYRVEVACAYDQAADSTTCTFTGIAPPEAKDVSHVDLPASEVCAEVRGGDHEYVDPDPNTRVVGYKSRGSQGTFTLVLTGQVTSGGTTTYWFKTGDGIFPATGPGLRCDEEIAQPALQATVATTGTQVPAATAPAEIRVTFELELVATVQREADAGAIRVQTHACGAAPSDPATFDWYGACQPGGEGVPFALRKQEGTELRDAGDGATDAGGVLRFEALASGTYRLRGIDVVWCHAEADHVDAQGDLVIETGRQVTVWVFFCGEEPPK